MKDLNSILTNRARAILTSDQKPLTFTERIISDVLHAGLYDHVTIHFLSTKDRKLVLAAPNVFIANEIRFKLEDIKTKINRQAGRLIVSDIAIKAIH